MYIFPVAQQPNSGLGRLTVEVTSWHTDTHSVGVLFTSDQLVAEAATYKTHNSRTFMPSAGFETTIPAVEPQQTVRPLRWAIIVYLFIFRSLCWISRCPHADQISPKLPAPNKSFSMPELRYGVKFPGKKRMFSLLDNPQTALVTTQLPTQWVSGVLFVGLKLPEREANLCRLCWRYKCTFMYVFMTCVI